MNGPTLAQAIDTLRASSYPQDIFTVIVCRGTGSDGTFHVPQSPHLETPMLVTGTLATFLDGPRCGRRPCGTWVTKLGPAAEQAGRLIQAVVEAETMIQDWYQSPRVPRYDLGTEQFEVLAPLQRLSNAADITAYAEMYRDAITARLTQLRSDAIVSLRSPTHRRAVVDDVIARTIDGEQQLFAPLANLVSASLQEHEQDTRRGYAATKLNPAESWVGRYHVTSSYFSSVADIDIVLDTLPTLIPVRLQQLDGIFTAAVTNAEPSAPIDETLATVWREQVRSVAHSCRDAVRRLELELRHYDTVSLSAWPRSLHPSNADELLLSINAAFGWRHASRLMLVPAAVASMLQHHYQADVIREVPLPEGITAINADAANLGPILTGYLETCELLWTESDPTTIPTLADAWSIAQNL